jgi:hypothetical protein
MSLIAFTIVFVVIIGLMLIMMGLKHIANFINAAQTVSADVKQSAPAPPGSVSNIVAAPPSAPLPPSAATQDDGELIAVITAAISAAAGCEIRVAGYSPTPAAVLQHPSSVWRMTGILQNSQGLGR